MPPEAVLEREQQAPAYVQCSRCAVSSVAFCAGLTAADVARLSGIAGQVQMPAHDTLFREGDAAEHLYTVIHGAVKLYKLLPDGRRQITAFLFPGDFFGLGVGGAYAYTAETLTPVRLCRFPRPKLDRLLAEAPSFENKLLALTIQDLAQAQEHMLLLGRKTAREKLATFLLRLSRGARRRGLAPSPVALPMSRSDIADHLGLTIETVSRTFTQLKREGVIGIPDLSHVILHQPEALRTIADGG